MINTSFRIHKLLSTVFITGTIGLFLLISSCKDKEDTTDSPQKVDFVKCKINGVDFNSKMTLGSAQLDSIGYRHIVGYGDDSDTPDIVDIAFHTYLPTGTYQAGSGDFFASYLENDNNEYQSTRGTLVLTSVTDRAEGTFSFTGKYSQDSVVVTEGSFSFKIK